MQGVTDLAYFRPVFPVYGPYKQIIFWVYWKGTLTWNGLNCVLYYVYFIQHPVVDTVVV